MSDDTRGAGGDMTHGLTPRALLVGVASGLLVSLPTALVVDWVPRVVSVHGREGMVPWPAVWFLVACMVAALFLPHLAGALSVTRVDLSQDDARRVGAWAGGIAGLVAAMVSLNLPLSVLGTVGVLDLAPMRALAEEDAAPVIATGCGVLMALVLLGTSGFAGVGATMGARGAGRRNRRRTPRGPDTSPAAMSPWVWLVTLAIAHVAAHDALARTWSSLALLGRGMWGALEGSLQDALVVLSAGVLVATMVVAAVLPAALAHRAGQASHRLGDGYKAVVPGVLVCLGVWGATLALWELLREGVSPIAHGAVVLWMVGWFLHGRRTDGPAPVAALSWRDLGVGGVLAWVVIVATDGVPLVVGTGIDLTVTANLDALGQGEVLDADAIRRGLTVELGVQESYQWQHALDVARVVGLGVVLAAIAARLVSASARHPSDDAHDSTS